MADDELDDRLSRRFEGGESDEKPEGTQTDMNSSSQIDETSQKSQKVKNIKKEWNVRSIYLDDDLNTRVTTAFKRLDLDVSKSEADIDLKKTRHFYPLLVQLGLERLEEMEVAEVTERLEDTE